MTRHADTDTDTPAGRRQHYIPPFFRNCEAGPAAAIAPANEFEEGLFPVKKRRLKFSMRSFHLGIAARRIVANAAPSDNVIDLRGQDVGPGDIEIARGRDIRIGRAGRIPPHAIGQVREIFDRATAEEHARDVAEAAESDSSAIVEFVSEPGTEISSEKDFSGGDDL
jgi:hypothetical protein